MNRPRAADDFATIRARMEELRRERERTQAAEGEPQRKPQTYRGREVRWTASEVSGGPGRVGQPGSGMRLDRDRARWTRG
jgi:hypothetical protein